MRVFGAVLGGFVLVLGLAGLVGAGTPPIGTEYVEANLLQTSPTMLRPAEPAAAPRLAQAATAIPIRVYFSRHPRSDEAFTEVFPVARTSPDRGVASAALKHLIEGPTQAERAEGYFSELGGALVGPSNCGGRDFQVEVRDGGMATVRFCRTVSSAGIGQDARIRSQIEATLRQFSTVRQVRLLTSTGHCLFDESGLDRCLSDSPASPPRPGTR